MQPQRLNEPDTAAQTTSVTTRIVAWLRTVFSLDLRSIALFRILLALLILWDLALRSQHLTAFYTDQGVLAREFWLAITNPLHTSVHAASGAAWWQVLLFVLASVFAIGLLLGYQTRLMAFASFILLVSLINRNTLILHAGDQLLVVMCFWSLFLPLNARWSIDAALQPTLKTQPNSERFDPDAPQLVFSVATIAIVLQVLYLYIFTALLKTGSAWTVRFDAAFYAISLDQMATPIAIWARQFPEFFKLATVYVLVVEFLAPLLILLPFRWPWSRLLGLALLASLHIGFLAMLHIGLFPFIDFMALSLLLPSAVWIRLHQYRKKTKRYKAINKVVIYYDEDCGFCLKMCLVLRQMLLHPTVPILTAQSNPAIYNIMLRHNSWVVKDANNTTYVHWHAMQFLFSQRWPFKPIGWLLNFKPLMALGNRMYRWVAVNRGTMGRVTAWALPWRTLSTQPTLLGSILAAFFLFAVTVHNISGMPGLKNLQPDFVETAVRITRLEQRWDMFAPFPLKLTRYPQIPGKTRVGEDINLYPTTGTDPDWEPPSYLAAIHDGYRWRKYMGRIEGYKNDAIRRGYGRYLCKTYNATKPVLSADQLVTFEIWMVKLRTNTTASPREKTRKRVWRHWCFGSFKPNK